MKIIFSADLQVKCREDNLFRSAERSLNGIYDVIKSTKAECYCIIGDFFEYPTPNDSERKLINNHIGKVLALDTVKEVVLMCGNHDLQKERKIEEHQRGFNPINIIVDFVNSLDNKLASKITYCKSTESYISKADNSLVWLPYSLEDQEIWRNVEFLEKQGMFGVLSSDKNYICLYHDILKEYVDQTNLPIQRKRYNELMSINDFPSDIIFAGDIHKNWGCFSYDDNTQKINKRFTYTGSPYQHTHSEGSYLIINESTKNSDIIGETKVVKCFDTDGFKDIDNLEKYVSDINLKDFISYITINIDNSISEDNLLELFHNKIKQIKFGIEQTYIKIKSASNLISKEKDLYEELQYLITTNNYKRVVIDFTYDKFVDINISTSSNETIKELQQEIVDKENQKNTESSEVITDITKIDNIDSLILDQTKLNKLFNSVLDDTLKSMKLAFDEDITESYVKEEITNLFEEELSKALVNNKRFDIRFDYIECNGFMLLGPNRIQLDYPGITRIVGSNGVGKTTLFNMLRWSLTGKLFEELSDRNTTQNTLLVFNDKNPELNIIITKTALFINGQHVIIERKAERIWKSNVSDEQKLAKNWKSYISKVYMDVKMTVINSKGEESVYTGDQVNKILKYWFGETISTILFLNYDRIKNLLNSNSDNLKQLVLSYIGVNYLQKLEDALPTIKTKLEVVRPKDTKESLRSNIEMLRDSIKNDTIELDIHKSKIEPMDNEIKSYENQVKDNSDKLINLGNIENILKEKREDKNALFDKINSFEKQEPKELIPFNIKKPEEPNTKELNQKLDVLNTNINDLNSQVSDKETTIENEYQKLIQDINNKILDIKTKWNQKKESYQNTIDTNTNIIETIEKEIIDTFKKLIDENNIAISEKENSEEIVSINNKISEIKNNVVTYLTTIIDKLKIAKDSKQNRLLTTVNIIDKTNDELSDINKQIESGICPTCNRPFDNFENKIIELKETKTLLETKINEFNITKEQQENEFNKAKNTLDLYQGYLLKLSVYEFDGEWYNNLLDYQKQNVLEIIDLQNQIIDIQKSNELFIKDCNNENKLYNLVVEGIYKDSYYVFDNNYQTAQVLKYNEQINKIKETKEIISSTKIEIESNESKINMAFESLDLKRDKLMTKFYERNFDNYKDNSEYLEKNNLVTLFQYYIDLKNIQNNIESKKTELQKTQSNINSINSEYQQLIKEYTESLEENNRLNKEIQDFNKGVDEHNNLINIYNLNFEKLKNEIENLETIKLPEYNKLKEIGNNLSEKLLQLRVDLKKIEEDKHICELNISRKNLQLNELIQKYEEYLKYQRNKLIYDIYKKLIETSFKDIVFEYYRTYMNNTLNILLEDMYFKLIWTPEGELYMCDLRNGDYSFRPVMVTSGMETSFLGLALIYTMHVLNIKNTISLMLIDELSGQLNKGENLTYKVENYQELFVTLLNKFKNKSLIVVDHNIVNLYETAQYEVIPNKENGSKYILKI